MPRNAAAYDEDFYAWTQEQARLLRSGRFSEIDVENVAEELESMGRSDKRELDSRLEVLLMQLLKWQVQTGFRSRSWMATIRVQRSHIDESPSLRLLVSQTRPGLYACARSLAASETGLPETVFPEQCPFTPEQVLAEEFLPE